VEGLVRIRPGYDIHEEEDFSVSMINLALDGLPIHPDGISGEQAISIPWDYVSLGRGINQDEMKATEKPRPYETESHNHQPRHPTND